MSKLMLSVVGAALIASAAPTFAANGFDNQILSNQTNLNTVFADLNLYAKWVGGDVRGTAAAIGNNSITTTAGSTLWMNLQYQPADVGASLTATVKGVGGDVDLSAVGICNNTSLTTTESRYTEGWSEQRCATKDPYAVLSANVFGVDGGVGLKAASIANNAVVDVTTGAMNMGINQANASAVYASVNATVVDVAGDVTASAIAIGNNASITGRFGGTP